MEVAAFHPPGFYPRGLVSVALFVTSPCQGVTLHPALRSPDFPLCCAQRLPGRLPPSFYALEGAEVARVVVELRGVAARQPAGIAENRQHGETRRRDIRRQRAQPGT